MAAFFFALGLFALLVVIGMAFYWQGSIHLPGAAVSYGVEDSIKYITPRLSDTTREVIGPKSVRRILEWEMKYVQDQLDADPEQPVVLGGDAVQSYILDETVKQGFDYQRDTVREVLQLQAAYMESIGAIAQPVGDDELKTMGLNDNG